MSGRETKSVDDRRADDLRELRLILPDARLEIVKQRVAQASARLADDAEDAAIRWTEAVSEFDGRDDDLA